MPNLKRCEAGIHTYDHDKHVQCPYCGVSSLMPNTEKYDPQKQGGTAFDDNKTKAYDASSATQAYRPDGAGARPANDPNVTQGLWQKKHGIDPVLQEMNLSLVMNMLNCFLILNKKDFTWPVRQGELGFMSMDQRYSKLSL